LLENPWFPSNTYNFPFSLHSKGGRDVKRFVGLHHLKAHHWLVLSDLHRGLYCKYCVLFSGEYGSHQSSSQLGKLVKTGKDFLITYHAPQLEVINQVNSQRLVQVQENRPRLRPIIETIILCGRQNIPLRGHKDDGYVLEQNLNTVESVSSVNNDGNFRELLRFRVAAGDTKLENHLKNASANATYIGKNTQNELINACGEEVLQNLIEKSTSVSVVFNYF